MINRKLIGSYYTPKELADFVVDYLAYYLEKFKKIKVIEPSAGNGIFINAFLDHKILTKNKGTSFTIIEREAPELETIKKNLCSRKLMPKMYNCISADFLDIHTTLGSDFTLALGNPPYINKRKLTKSQILACQDIHTNSNLSPKKINNIWTAFLVRSSELLSEDGILAFVLPAELMQVQFAEEIRLFLYDRFQRVEYFSFRELLFDAEGQDTVLLIAHKKHPQNGIFHATINNVNDLIVGNFQLSRKDNLQLVSTKEIHHDLTNEEWELLADLKRKLLPISHYVDSKPGVVTAANKFFIVNDDLRKKIGLDYLFHPIIQKGSFVNGSVVFGEQEMQKLITNGKPSYLLDLNNCPIEDFPDELTQYIKYGELEDIPNRYKCLLRDRWYDVPNVSTPWEGLFFKRSHEYPKVLKNTANALVTDSAYKIKMKQGFNLDSFIFSFYNTLTLVFSEIEGRFYGGGVLELTPSEFKKLPIPYTEITEERFKIFKERFDAKVTIEDILDHNDFETIFKIEGITTRTIKQIRVIRQKLLDKRFRKVEERQ
jgi:adenine-specific DNA-methyltransferase